MNEGGIGGAPKPELNVYVSPSSTETAPEQTREVPAPQEFAGNKPATPVVTASAPSHVSAQPVQTQSAVTPPADPVSNQTIVDTTALHAQDQDRIEKEWIDAVKIISSKTRSDPFVQKNEMSKIKADYLRKRFNKTIKTNNTGAP